MHDEDTTEQLSPGGGRQQRGRTLDDLFSLVQSLRGEFTEFSDKVEVRLLRTTPLSETLEAVRADVGIVAERQDTLRIEVAEIRTEVAEIRTEVAAVRTELTEVRTEVAAVRTEVAEIARAVTEIAKASRRIESKVNGISIDFSEIKGTLQNHEVRLQALNSE